MSLTSVIGLLLCLFARVGDEQLVTNHEDCSRNQGAGSVGYVKGVNIAGFKKVADAMLAFGVV
ncbi:MAG: hypothetical protein ABJK59_02280 [Erythrobacter sp.]|uniref:hypothetical protein n=1 Tax=Erythrobacter sp. TaxID=1042 RepID=UPI003297D7B1